MNPQLEEERQRLDKMRSDKFKFIMDAMASHAIEETNSEYSASFLSGDGRRGSANPHHNKECNKGTGYEKERNNSTVLEVEEMSDSSLIQEAKSKRTRDRYINRYNKAA